jgi:hypothetical protein
MPSRNVVARNPVSDSAQSLGGPLGLIDGGDEEKPGLKK